MPVARPTSAEEVTSGIPIERATPGDPTKFFVKQIVFEGNLPAVPAQRRHYKPLHLHCGRSPWLRDPKP